MGAGRGGYGVHMRFAILAIGLLVLLAVVVAWPALRARRRDPEGTGDVESGPVPPRDPGPAEGPRPGEAPPGSRPHREQHGKP